MICPAAVSYGFAPLKEIAVWVTRRARFVCLFVPQTAGTAVPEVVTADSFRASVFQRTSSYVPSAGAPRTNSGRRVENHQEATTMIAVVLANKNANKCFKGQRA